MSFDTISSEYLTLLFGDDLNITETTAYHLLRITDPAYNLSDAQECISKSTPINAQQVLTAYHTRNGPVSDVVIEAIRLDLGRVRRARESNVKVNIMTGDITPSPIASVSLPVEHVVLITLKPDTSAADAEHLCRVMGLLTQIPGVLAVRAGAVKVDLFPDMADRANGINLILYVLLTDGAALAGYGPHPLHEYVRDHCIRRLAAGPAGAVDFIDQSGHTQ